MNKRLVGLVMRHGDSSANEMGIFRSWLDVPLTKLGLQQAVAAAKFLSRYQIDRIICSPLLRSFLTANIVSQSQKLEVLQHRGLFPWRLGIFSGLPKEENESALDLFVKNPQIPLPSGESLDNFEDRQYAFWSAALGASRKSGELSLFVCHNSVVTALAHMITGAGDDKILSGESIKPGGVAEIHFDGKHHAIRPVFGISEPAQFGGS